GWLADGAPRLRPASGHLDGRLARDAPAAPAGGHGRRGLPRRAGRARAGPPGARVVPGRRLAVADRLPVAADRSGGAVRGPGGRGRRRPRIAPDRRPPVSRRHAPLLPARAALRPVRQVARLGVRPPRGRRRRGPPTRTHPRRPRRPLARARAGERIRGGRPTLQRARADRARRAHRTAILRSTVPRPRRRSVRGGVPCPRAGSVAAVVAPGRRDRPVRGLERGRRPGRCAPVPGGFRAILTQGISQPPAPSVRGRLQGRPLVSNPCAGRVARVWAPWQTPRPPPPGTLFVVSSLTGPEAVLAADPGLDARPSRPLPRLRCGGSRAFDLRSSVGRRVRDVGTRTRPLTRQSYRRTLIHCTFEGSTPTHP